MYNKGNWPEGCVCQQMEVRFTGSVAEAAGLHRTSLSLQISLTVAEVQTILVNLYPGIGRLGGIHHPDRWQVLLNQKSVDSMSLVTDGDVLEIAER